MIEITRDGDYMIARVGGEAAAYAHRMGEGRPWILVEPETAAEDSAIEKELRALAMRRLEDAVYMAERGLRAAQEHLAKAKEETK